MDYKQEYYEMKKKYLALKNKILEDISIRVDQTGGSIRLDSTFINENDGMRYRVYRTEENRMFTFREVPFRDVDKNELTSNLRRPDKRKILYIDDLDTFNYFTNKYGRYDTWDIYVAWDKVAKDYKGFYLNKNNKDLFLHVYAKARKGNYRMGSWWAGEYQGLTNDVMIFI